MPNIAGIYPALCGLVFYDPDTKKLSSYILRIKDLLPMYVLSVTAGPGGQDAFSSAVQLLRTELAESFAARKKKRFSSRFSIFGGGGGGGGSGNKSNGSLQTSSWGKQGAASSKANVTLAISSKGISVMEPMGGGYASIRLPTEAIVYTSVANANTKYEVFACISDDPKLAAMTCYMFRVPEICLVIGAASQLAKLDAQEESPFAPVSSAWIQSGIIPPELDPFTVNRRLLEPVKDIGQGQFGSVWLANQMASLGSSSFEPVAVKQLRDGTNNTHKVLFLKEALAMAELQHTNLASLKGLCMQHNPWLVILEFCQYGDLKDVLQACVGKGIETTEHEKLLYLSQVAKGMAYMASKRYVHRDLAARNCLLHVNNLVKVSDFGLAVPFDPGQKTYLMRKSGRLSIRWTDPAGCTTHLFSEWSDVWSFGVLMWEIYTHAMIVPYNGIGLREVLDATAGGMRLPKPDRVSAMTRANLRLKSQSTKKMEKKMEKKVGKKQERERGGGGDAGAASVANDVPHGDVAVSGPPPTDVPAPSSVPDQSIYGEMLDRGEAAEYHSIEHGSTSSPHAAPPPADAAAAVVVPLSNPPVFEELSMTMSEDSNHAGVTVAEEELTLANDGKLVTKLELALPTLGFETQMQAITSGEDAGKGDAVSSGSSSVRGTAGGVGAAGNSSGMTIVVEDVRGRVGSVSLVAMRSRAGTEVSMTRVAGSADQEDIVHADGIDDDEVSGGSSAGEIADPAPQEQFRSRTETNTMADLLFMLEGGDDELDFGDNAVTTADTDFEARAVSVLSSLNIKPNTAVDADADTDAATPPSSDDDEMAF
eukprot:gene1471-19382_t